MLSSAMPNAAKFRTQNHNHSRCISHALEQAANVCQKQKLRFTPIRRRVFELVWDSHKPVVAYDILKKLRDEKTNAEPPTVYRALDFLLTVGLVHKIESLSAYVGCEHTDKSHVSQFLICTDCRQTIELNDQLIQQTIEQQAAKTGFEIRNQIIEIKGMCPACQA